MFLKTDILEQSLGFYFVKSFFGVEIIKTFEVCRRLLQGGAPARMAPRKPPK